MLHRDLRRTLVRHVVPAAVAREHHALVRGTQAVLDDLRLSGDADPGEAVVAEGACHAEPALDLLLLPDARRPGEALPGDVRRRHLAAACADAVPLPGAGRRVVPGQRLAPDAPALVGADEDRARVADVRRVEVLPLAHAQRGDGARFPRVDAVRSLEFLGRVREAVDDGRPVAPVGAGPPMLQDARGQLALHEAGDVMALLTMPVNDAADEVPVAAPEHEACVLVRLRPTHVHAGGRGSPSNAAVSALLPWRPGGHSAAHGLRATTCSAFKVFPSGVQ
mmetsp:Transcript_42432/g.132328  ORF Transcript_42432/g.132328 Transcript_42432/m.132328 type:complete len:279 (-) Transcript_42432:393-1229(-)